MKKLLFLTTMFCLLAISALAQDKKVDYSGNWTLDLSKSKLDERMRVESMTMNVTQTEKDLKVETTIKRTPPPEGSGGGQGNGIGSGRGGGGGFGRGGGFGNDGTTTYSLDGKETKAGEITRKAKVENDGKLKLNSSRSFETPNGAISITTKDTWSLSADGKTLTVKRDMETPRGTNSSEMVFTKK